MAKFTVDGPNRLLIAKAGVTDVDVQIDLYSDAKEHWLTTDDAKFPFPFRTIAGDVIGPGKNFEAGYFITNDWKIRPDEADHDLNFTGNLFLDEGEAAGLVVPTVGAFTVLGAVERTGDGRTLAGGGGGPTLPQIINGLLDEPAQNHTLLSTVGQKIALTLYGGAIWIDTKNGVAGSILGLHGHQANPVNNLADAITLAASILPAGFKKYMIKGNITLTSAHDDWEMVGIGEGAVVNINGQDIADSRFEDLEISGAMNGTNSAHFHDCDIDGLTNIIGVLVGCRLRNSLSLGAGQTTFDQCSSLVPGAGATPILDCVGAGRTFNMRHYSGGIELRNMSDVSNIGTIEMVAGQAIFASTCSAGEVSLRGIGNRTNNSTGTFVLEDNAFINRTDISFSVWEEILSAATHNTPNSAGRRVRQLEIATVLRNNSIGVGSTTTNIVLDAGAATEDEFYRYLMLQILEGPAAGQVRIISDYNGTTKTATITPPLVTAAPVSGNEYQVVALGPSHAATVATGYAGASVWINTNASNTNTSSFVDGTADNPVSTLAAAITIANNLGLAHLHFVPGSSITLTQSVVGFTINGVAYSIDLGGQDISGVVFDDAKINGSAVAPTSPPTFAHCNMGVCTLPPCTVIHSSITGDHTMGSAGDFFYDDCYSGIAGTATPKMTFVANSNLNYRHYSGGLQLEAMVVTNNMSLEGEGQLVEGTCTGGTVAIRGEFTVSGITNITLVDGARFDTTQVENAVWDANKGSHSVIGSTGEALANGIPGPTYVLDQQVYDGPGGALSTARKRIYTDGGLTTLIRTMAITVIYTGNELTDYREVEV